MVIRFDDPSDDSCRVSYETASIFFCDLLFREYGPGIYLVTVGHDDDCPKLLSGEECTCRYILTVEVPNTLDGSPN